MRAAGTPVVSRMTMASPLQKRWPQKNTQLAFLNEAGKLRIRGGVSVRTRYNYAGRPHSFSQGSNCRDATQSEGVGRLNVQCCPYSR